MTGRRRALKGAVPNIPSVSIVSPFAVFGAAEDYVVILANGLARRGREVVLHVPRAAVADFVGRVLPSVSVAVLPDNALTSIFGAISWLRGIRNTILHLNHFPLYIAAAHSILRHAAPVFVTNHTPALPMRLSRRGRALRNVGRRRVFRWITLSAQNRELFLRDDSVDPGSVVAIPPGLPRDRFLPLPRSEARNQLHLAETDIVIGTLGRLSQQKRHDVLIRAVALLRDELPSLKLVILGEGELREATGALASALLDGMYSMPGHVADAPRLLRAFDVFCLSSDFEGLPFALLEAMASEVPIVTTNVQGCSDALRNEIDGLVVPPGSAEVLSLAIKRIVTNGVLARRYVSSARKRFEEQFVDDVMVDQISKLYDGAAGTVQRTS